MPVFSKVLEEHQFVIEGLACLSHLLHSCLKCLFSILDALNAISDFGTLLFKFNI